MQTRQLAERDRPIHDRFTLAAKRGQFGFGVSIECAVSHTPSSAPRRSTFQTIELGELKFGFAGALLPLEKVNQNIASDKMWTLSLHDFQPVARDPVSDGLDMNLEKSCDVLKAIAA